MSGKTTGMAEQPDVRGKGGGAFEHARTRFLVACGAIVGGLAIAGSLDRTTGGVIILCGWLGGIATLHRLGRAGSERR